MSPFDVYQSVIPGLSNGKGATIPRDNVVTPSDDAIAERAYQLFLARGGEHGFDLEDWADARRDLMGEALVSSKTPPDGPADA